MANGIALLPNRTGELERVVSHAMGSALLSPNELSLVIAILAEIGSVPKAAKLAGVSVATAEDILKSDSVKHCLHTLMTTRMTRAIQDIQKPLEELVNISQFNVMDIMSDTEDGGLYLDTKKLKAHPNFGKIIEKLAQKVLRTSYSYYKDGEMLVFPSGENTRKVLPKPLSKELLKEMSAEGGIITEEKFTVLFTSASFFSKITSLQMWLSLQKHVGAFEQFMEKNARKEEYDLSALDADEQATVSRLLEKAKITVTVEDEPKSNQNDIPE